MKRNNWNNVESYYVSDAVALAVGYDRGSRDSFFVLDESEKCLIGLSEFLFFSLAQRPTDLFSESGFLLPSLATSLQDLGLRDLNSIVNRLCNHPDLPVGEDFFEDAEVIIATWIENTLDETEILELCSNSIPIVETEVRVCCVRLNLGFPSDEWFVD